MFCFKCENKATAANCRFCTCHARFKTSQGDTKSYLKNDPLFTANNASYDYQL